jgi:hypothetical protein
MFKIFEANYARDVKTYKEDWDKSLVPDILGLQEFFTAYAGAAFEGGLYRILWPTDLARWQERIDLAFPGYGDRVVCFGYDWGGRVFALDTERLEDGQAGVLLLEPGTGEILRIPSNLQTFHNRELIEFGEAALGTSFYEKWRANGGEAVDYDCCIGYRVPLFLGGVDDIENLEDSDLDVYWHIMGQLIQKIDGLPEGTRINVSL